MNKLDALQKDIPTLAFTSSLDMRQLATLCKFWQLQEATPRSISELVRLSLKSLVEIIVTNNFTPFVPTQEEAQDILGSVGLLNKGILKKNLLKAIAREADTEVLFSTPTASSTSDDPLTEMLRKRVEETLRRDEENKKYLSEFPESEEI